MNKLRIQIINKYKNYNKSSDKLSKNINKNLKICKKCKLKNFKIYYKNIFNKIIF